MDQLLRPGAEQEDVAVDTGEIREVPDQRINACGALGGEHCEPRFQRCRDVFILHDAVEFVNSCLYARGRLQ